MNISVNGDAHELPNERLTIEALLDHLDIAQRKGMAVALNLSVVPRSEWAVREVAEGDEVEIVRATQGG